MNAPLLLPVRALLFVLWFTGQVIVTSVRVSVLILTPGRQPAPGIVRTPLQPMSEAELTLFVALVTITPDTLVIAIDRENHTLHVHGMFVASDAEGFRAALTDAQNRLLRAVRLRPPLSVRREEPA